MARGSVLAWLLLVVSGGAFAATEEDYRAFLGHFEAMGNTFDPALIQLYADHAVINETLLSSTGAQPQTRNILGQAWKMIVAARLDSARKIGDTATFSNISVAEDGDGTLIRAHRTVTLKCFVDERYYMRVRPDEEGKLRIEVEVFAVPETSLCETSQENSLELALYELGNLVSRKLPAMLDSEFRFDQVAGEGKVLKHHFTMVNHLAGDVPVEQFEGAKQKQDTENICANRHLRAAMKQGATIVYRYQGSDEKTIHAFEVNEVDCPG